VASYKSNNAGTNAKEILSKVIFDFLTITASFHVSTVVEPPLYYIYEVDGLVTEDPAF
jgi:hypothetical protein